MPVGVSVGQRDHVLDVQLAGIGDRAPGIGTKPLAADDLALSPALIGHRTGRLGDEDLLPRVLPPLKDFAEVLDVGDLVRSYQVHVPAGYDGTEQPPLLIALHGGGGGAAGMRESTGLDAMADE